MYKFLYNIKTFISVFFLSISLRSGNHFLGAIIYWLNIRRLKSINSNKQNIKKILFFPKSGGTEDLINSFMNYEKNDLVFYYLPRVFIKKVFVYYFKNLKKNDYFTKITNSKAKNEKKLYIDYLTNVFRILNRIWFFEGFISFNIFYYAEKQLEKVSINLGKKHIILHKESAFTPIEEKSFPKYLMKLNEKSLAHKISVYSESQKKILVRSKIVRKDQIIINGCPRSDYSFKLRNIKPKEKNIVHFLIETDRYNMNKFQKLIGERNLNWKNLHNNTIRYLIEFAIKNPDVNVIFKGKIGSHKKELFDKIFLPKNCTYIFEGTGERYLKDAKVVIAFNSTIVFETIASNRNLIIPNFNNEKTKNNLFMHQINNKKYYVNNKKIFFEKIEFYLNSQYKNLKISDTDKQTLQYYLGNIDGKSGIRMKKFLIKSFS